LLEREGWREEERYAAAMMVLKISKVRRPSAIVVAVVRFAGYRGRCMR
jgi:hypothetical protein